MKTFQDFEQATDVVEFIKQAINEYKASDEYKIALDADEYEAQRNRTIMEWVKYLYNMTGQKVVDFTASNNKIASNFFHRLNTQRVAYSLGNGVSFTNTAEETVNGVTKNVDVTKRVLGKDFDKSIYKGAYYGLIHGVCYLMWNFDHLEIFPMTQFVPLWDEFDGSLKAGIRFWSLDWENRPVTAVLYEEDGYTKYRTKKDSKGLDIAEYEPKRGYIQTVKVIGESEEVIGEENYSNLPIVPLWGNKHKQSNLVGMRAGIDSYDLIRSGFANDLQECAEIYWLIGNALGEDDASLAKFRDRLKLNHIVAVDDQNSSVTPYTQEVPTQAREVFLAGIRSQIYEDFGGLDVHTVAAGATNDHIDAAYQPMDEEADDFETLVTDCIKQILKLNGIEDEPIYKRNRISNQTEQTQMVLLAADYLDSKTVLSKLPWLTVDEVEAVMQAKIEEQAALIQEVGMMNE